MHTRRAVKTVSSGFSLVPVLSPVYSCPCFRKYWNIVSFVTERAEQNDDNFITILAIALGGAGLLLVIVLIVVVVVVVVVVGRRRRRRRRRSRRLPRQILLHLSYCIVRPIGQIITL